MTSSCYFIVHALQVLYDVNVKRTEISSPTLSSGPVIWHRIIAALCSVPFPRAKKSSAWCLGRADRTSRAPPTWTISTHHLRLRWPRHINWPVQEEMLKSSSDLQLYCTRPYIILGPRASQAVAPRPSWASLIVGSVIFVGLGAVRPTNRLNGFSFERDEIDSTALVAIIIPQ